MFNRIEVWGIRRQEAQCSPRSVQEIFGLGAFVEGDVIHHYNMRVVQKRAKFLFEPRIEEGSIASAFTQDWRFKDVSYSRGNEGGARPAVAGD